MTTPTADVPEALDLDVVRADASSLTDLPWCFTWMRSGIRHLVRNCDLACSEHTDLFTGRPLDDEVRCEGPGRHDGEAIARLVNTVPALLAEIDRLRAQVTA